MTLDEIIARLERDRAAHTMSGPSDEEELRRTERALGHPLPAALRCFLARLGGGIFYGRHEIFGCHRVMIHDIELVPSLRSVRGLFAREAPAPGPELLPFHRAEGRLHVIDLSSALPAVTSWPPGETHPSFELFLEEVVLKASAPQR